MIKQGDKIELRIEDYGSNGEGIAKYDGYVVFVPYTVVGEKVKARITYVKKTFANAVLEEVLEKSDLRKDPPCNRFGKCGGCDIMHIEYDEQLKLKQSSIQNTFSKNYKKEIQIEPTVPSDKVFGYRNKVSLPFGVVNGKIALGFYRENTHKIVSITKCFLQGEWIETLIKVVLEYANELKLTVYDENKNKGLLKHLVARYVDSHLTVTLVTTNKLPQINKLVKVISENYNSFALYQNINKSNGNSVFCGKVELLAGNEKPLKVRNILAPINPLSFLQVNEGIRDKIYDKVEELVELHSGQVVIDAYAGIGILGANLAKKGIKVFNIEIVEEAKKDADKLAKLNGLENYITNICGDSAEELPKLVSNLKLDLSKYAHHKMNLRQPYFDSISSGTKIYELRLNDEKRQLINLGDTICFNEVDGNKQLLVKVKNKFLYKNFEDLFTELGTVKTGFGFDLPIKQASETMLEFYSKENVEKYGALALEVEPITPTLTVILDPPRKGCDTKVLDTLKEINLDSLIYISCNPATLSRDLNYLSDTYQPTFVTPYDMFPNTRHTECLTMLKRIEE